MHAHAAPVTDAALLLSLAAELPPGAYALARRAKAQAARLAGRCDHSTAAENAALLAALLEAADTPPEALEADDLLTLDWDE